MAKIDKSNFSEWYNKVLELAEIVDIRYPVKGMPVYMGNGFRIMKRIFTELEGMLDQSGHQQMYFPVFIGEDEFGKEEDHIKGFSNEVFAIEDENRKLVVRPTSETAMYPMFKLWLQTHAQLPFRIHQTVCVYRKETKATRPLIRGREVYWNEAHTAHATRDEAVKQVEEGVGIYSRLFDWLGVPYAVLVRPKHDTFPGADYTVAFDTVLPDGKILQIGTVHNLGQSFSKAYGVEILLQDNTKGFAHLTCYGVSMRALAAVVALHGDEKGIVLPTMLSEHQFVIIPVVKKGNEQKVMDYCREIEAKLRELAEVKIDDTPKTSGDKHYHWELRGIPFRVEIGEREVDADAVFIKDRLGNSWKVGFEQITGERIGKMKVEFNAQVAARARKNFEMEISSAVDKQELKDRKGLVLAGWCEDPECEKHVREKHFIEVRGYFFSHDFAKKERDCIVCGKTGFEYLFGKPY